MGGIEDRSRHVGPIPPRRVLVLRGFLMMGGVTPEEPVMPWERLTCTDSRPHRPARGLPRRLALVCALVAGVFTQFGLKLGRGALALLVPFCFWVYAFVCLSAWLREAGRRRWTGRRRVACAGRRRIKWRRRSPAACGSRSTPRLDCGAEPEPRRSRRPPSATSGSSHSCFAIGVLLFLLSLAVHYVLLAFEAGAGGRAAPARARDPDARRGAAGAARPDRSALPVQTASTRISALTGSDAGRGRGGCALLLGDFLRQTLDVSARQRIPLARRARDGRALPEHRAGALRIAPPRRAAPRPRGVRAAWCRHCCYSRWSRTR